MEAIKLLIIIFGILFIIERRPMNIIFNFIGLIIGVSILLGKYETDYLSYLLIIIYCSALTIIFGFVIMLTPSENFKVNTNKISSLFFILPFIIFITYSTLNTSDISYISNDNIIEGEWSKTIINKIGEIIYMEEINIIRFIIATLILLLALVALFYILMPTL